MILVITKDLKLQNRWSNFWNKATLRECSAMGESIMLLHPGKKPNWNKLAQKAGQYASRVLCGDTVELPKERPWKRQDHRKMKEKILLNTLCSYSEQEEWVGLCDPEGKLCMLAWELAQRFPRVTVWCQFRERYQSLCELLLEELGAVLELCSSREGLMGCPIIGAMEAPPFRCQWDGLLLLVGKTDLPPLSGELRQNLRIAIPDELQAVTPCDVDAMDLYLAIMQENRQTVPNDLCFEISKGYGVNSIIENFP